MSDRLSLSDFLEHVHQKFQVTGETVGLELIEAKPLGTRGGLSAGGSREPFSLIFRGPFQAGLAQQIHALEHEAFGTLEIFLVPLGSEGDPDGTHYQAIFN